MFLIWYLKLLDFLNQLFKAGFNKLESLHCIELSWQSFESQSCDS